MNSHTLGKSIHSDYKGRVVIFTAFHQCSYLKISFLTFLLKESNRVCPLHFILSLELNYKGQGVK